jgi:hypothetical protein
MRARLLVETLLLEMLCVQLVLAISVDQGWSAGVNLVASIKATSYFSSNGQLLLVADDDTSGIQVGTEDVAGTGSPGADTILVAQGNRTLLRTTLLRAVIAASLAQAALASGKADQQAAQKIQQAVTVFPRGQFQDSSAAM